jgi:hypothetical protein
VALGEATTEVINSQPGTLLEITTREQNIGFARGLAKAEQLIGQLTEEYNQIIKDNETKTDNADGS